MKKALILYSGARTWGGIETYLYDLISYENKEIGFNVASMGEWDFTEKIKDKASVKIFSKARVNPILLFSLGRYCKKNNISVIVTQGVVSNFYGRLASIFYKVPNVCVVHSELEREYHNPIIRNLYLFTDFILKGVPKKYISVSEFLKEILLKRKIASTKIDVIYNGIKENARDKGQKTNDKFIIGSVGRLEKEKGYDVLIEGLKDIKEDFELWILGEGRERGELMKLIKSNKLEDKVKLLGYKNDLEKYYGCFDLYIQPSRTEGFGFTVIEAMSFGIPVIVSNEGALPELVTKNNGQILEELSPKNIEETVTNSLKNIETLKEKAVLGIEEVINKFDHKIWFEKTIKSISEVAK